MSVPGEWLHSENRVPSGGGARAWEEDEAQALLQPHPSPAVTSTDYDTAADATETSSYFSAQGYLSR